MPRCENPWGLAPREDVRQEQSGDSGPRDLAWRIATMVERLIGFCDTYPRWSGLGSWPLVAFTPAVPKPVLITVSWICGGDTRAGS